MSFIMEIEAADPNDEADEEENGLNWGHRLYSHKLGNIITSWEDVGNTQVARRLITAVIKTCKQARHVCAKLGVSGSYISDSYLDRTIDILRESWKEGGNNEVVPEPMPAQGAQDGSQVGVTTATDAMSNPSCTKPVSTASSGELNKSDTDPRTILSVCFF
jgi:hypothetical protein